MDKALMHWRSWGLLALFVSRFRQLPEVPDGVPPAQVSRLLLKSVLAGEVVAPLTLPPPIIHVNELPPRSIKRQRRSAKLRKYLDDL